ncbi:MAG TPA: phage terminase large subunit [Hyphomicrobiaceae bacterium]
MTVQTVAIDYTPLPRQAEFHRSPARYRAYIGGFGSGKTRCGCMEALVTALEHPGSLGVIARQTYPELRDTTQRTFFEECLPQELLRLSTWRRSEGHLILPNGSEVLFRYLENADETLKSLNLSWFYIDEASEVAETVFLMLQSRLRNPIGPRRGWITSNPAGHDWMYRRFVSREAIPPEGRQDYALIHAPTRENVHLPPGYVESLLSSYPPEWVRKYLDASFDVFEGQIFTEFDESKHVIDPLPDGIPEGWEKLAGFDYGLRNPTAVVWAAVDWDGNVIIYDEHYQAEWPPEMHAKEILRRGKVPIYADPSVFNRGPTGEAVGNIYHEQGVTLIPAQNDVDAGINRIHEWLSGDPPRLRIYRTCSNLIRELKGYRWAPRRTAVGDEPERPLKQDDHAVDALRYLLMARPQPTQRPEEPKPNTATTRATRHIERLVAARNRTNDPGYW